MKLTISGLLEIQQTASIDDLASRASVGQLLVAEMEALVRLAGGSVPASLRALQPLAIKALVSGLMPPPGETWDATSGDKGDGRIDASELYQTGFAIGLKPADVGAMTLWEFAQCVKGWNLAHGGEQAIDAPKQDELAELAARFG